MNALAVKIDLTGTDVPTDSFPENLPAGLIELSPPIVIMLPTTKET